MQISLIITTYNWPQALNLVLASVARQRRMPDEVIVADDGSGDETAQVIASWSRRLPVPLHHLWQENKGFRAARSRNRAIAAARSEYLVLIDGDMVLDANFVADHEWASERGWFVQGVRIMTNPALGARMLERGLIEVGPLTSGLRRRHRAVRSRWLSRHLSPRSVTMPRVKTCNQGCWRADLIAVNGFDERMIGWGPEDKECAARLLNAGVRGKEVRFAALATHLYHRSRASQGPDAKDAILESTIATRRTRCELGLDEHLVAFAHGVPEDALPPWRLQQERIGG